MEMECIKLLHCIEFKFNRKLVPFNLKTPRMTVLSSKIVCPCQSNKRGKDDYEESEQEQDMWNNIATLAEVLENKPPCKVRTPDKDREIRKLQWGRSCYIARKVPMCSWTR